MGVLAKRKRQQKPGERALCWLAQSFSRSISPHTARFSGAVGSFADSVLVVELHGGRLRAQWPHGISAPVVALVCRTTL